MGHGERAGEGRGEGQPRRTSCSSQKCSSSPCGWRVAGWARAHVTVVLRRAAAGGEGLACLAEGQERWDRPPPSTLPSILSCTGRPLGAMGRPEWAPTAPARRADPHESESPGSPRPRLTCRFSPSPPSPRYQAPGASGDPACARVLMCPRGPVSGKLRKAPTA